MDRPNIEDRFSRTPVLQVVLDMAQVFFQRADHITFHDPLAAAVVFEPTLCTFETGDVTINITADTHDYAYTHITPNPRGNAEAAVSVDSDAFFTEYFSTTTPT